MSEYINNLKINSNVNIQKENNNVSFQGIRTKDKKQDTFEKDKYKELKIRAGVFATGVAIWKRKEIGNIFERGWNKLKNIFSKGDAEETAKTVENIKSEIPKPGQKPEPKPELKPVIKLTPTEQLTKELSEIQKQIDPNVDTSKMKFGDILDLIDKEKETRVCSHY